MRRKKRFLPVKLIVAYLFGVLVFLIAIVAFFAFSPKHIVVEFEKTSGVEYLSEKTKDQFLAKIEYDNELKADVTSSKTGIKILPILLQDKKWHLIYNHDTNTTALYGSSLDLGKKIDSPLAAVQTSRDFIKENGEIIGITEQQLQQLKTDIVHHYDETYYTRFYQSVSAQSGFIHVYNSYTQFLMSDNGTLINADGGNVYSLDNVATTPFISADDAVRWVFSNLAWDERTSNHTIPVLNILPYKNPESGETVFPLVWRFNISRTQPYEAYEVFIDARDVATMDLSSSCLSMQGGQTRLCLKNELLFSDTIHGKVDKVEQTDSPVMYLRSGGITSDQTGHYTPNTNSVSNLRLSGTYATIYQKWKNGPQSSYSGSSQNISLDTAMKLDEQTAYWAVNKDRDYWERERSLDFGSSDSPLPVIVESDVVNNDTRIQGCNAYYDPNLNEINLGSTCQTYGWGNLGEYKKVTMHEYGHTIAIHYMPYYTWPRISSATSFGSQVAEGWADYVACTVDNDPNITPVGRTCSNTMQYQPGGEGHTAGQAFSGMLWDARNNIGRDTFDNLLSKTFNTGGKLDSSYQELLRQILTADDDDGILSNGTPHCNGIMNGFANHGITLSGVTCSATPPTNSNQNSTNRNQNINRNLNINARPRGNQNININRNINGNGSGNENGNQNNNSPTGTYRTCQNDRCVSVTGSGVDQCVVDSDCNAGIQNIIVISSPFNDLEIGHTIMGGTVQLEVTPQGRTYSWSVRGTGNGHLNMYQGNTVVYSPADTRGEDIISVSDGTSRAYADIQITFSGQIPVLTVTMTNHIIQTDAYPLNESLGVDIHDTIGFKAIGILPDATGSSLIYRDITSSVTWLSTYPEAGTIDMAGLFTAKNPSSTVISASLGSVGSNGITVHVNPAFPTVSPSTYQGLFNPNPVAKGYSTRLWLYVESDTTPQDIKVVSTDLSDLNIPPICPVTENNNINGGNGLNANANQSCNNWYMTPAQIEGNGRWYYKDFRVPFTVADGVYNIRIQATINDGRMDRHLTIPLRVVGEVIKGDVNGDGQLNIMDAILALQVAVGKIEKTDRRINVRADVNNDNEIGLPETIYALRATIQQKPL